MVTLLTLSILKSPVGMRPAGVNEARAAASKEWAHTRQPCMNTVLFQSLIWISRAPAAHGRVTGRGAYNRLMRRCGIHLLAILLLLPAALPGLHCCPKIDQHACCHFPRRAAPPCSPAHSAPDNILPQRAQLAAILAAGSLPSLNRQFGSAPRMATSATPISPTPPLILRI